jgi:serine/threonine protein kinase
MLLSSPFLNPLKPDASLSLQPSDSPHNSYPEMNKYRIVRQLGDGSFGTVMEGENQDTRERVTENNKVAIKKMKKKYYSWNECLNLREVKVFIR